MDKIYFKSDLKPREQQKQALEFIKKSIKNNKKNILLNMPTGSGKSYTMIMFANWYKTHINENAKFDIITNSKILQDQYIRDFPFIKTLKGMSNYYCNHHKTNCSEGKEINNILKRICIDCPYDKAKRIWMESDISTTNFALFVSMVLFTDNIKNKESNVLIIDEAHDFESVFCDFISTKLSRTLLTKCGFNQTIQMRYLKKFKTIKTSEDFINFIEKEFINDIQNMNEKITEKIKDNPDKSLRSTYRKRMVYILKLVERLDKLLDYYYENKKNWELDITYDKKNDIELILQPIWGYSYLKNILWDNYDHIIFMSGTILDKNMFSYINGLNPEESSYLEMDSTFKIKNRPLYYIKIGKMTYNEKVKTFERQVKIIEKILKKYKNKKGIIHTVNYEITDWVKEKINDDRLLFHDTDNRDEIYDKFINSKKPNVLVSPSMMTGISLDDEKARFSIMIKVPYPNISSNKIKSRQKSNKDWYNFKSVSDIIQSYGRTIRSETDYSDTFILDESFSNILKYNTKYLPKYFTNAIKILK